MITETDKMTFDPTTNRIQTQHARIEELEGQLLSATMDGQDMAKHEYRDRIEELEAKLAKAVEFTKGVIRHAGNSGDDYLAEQARTTLAELKGQDNE